MLSHGVAAVGLIVFASSFLLINHLSLPLGVLGVIASCHIFELLGLDVFERHILLFLLWGLREHLRVCLLIHLYSPIFLLDDI